MSVTLKWDGLDEFKADLERLPEGLTTESDPIVATAAHEAASEIRAAYPTRTGNLKKNVFVSRLDKGKDFVGYIVKNSAPHAFIFENGTQARHTSIGANRGAMPPGHVFVPAVIRRRRQMYEQLKALLVRHGLVVSGDA
jgi:Bacteriophage HK97-gp10, putative tail-component